MEPAAEVVGRVGAGRGQVAGLARVVVEVIELDVVVLEVFQELPVAGTDGADGGRGRVVVRVVEEQGVARQVGGGVAEQGGEAQRIERLGARALARREVVAQGREEVGQRDRLVGRRPLAA